MNGLREALVLLFLVVKDIGIECLQSELVKAKKQSDLEDRACDVLLGFGLRCSGLHTLGIHKAVSTPAAPWRRPSPHGAFRIINVEVIRRDTSI